ncbi:MAG: RNA polymerase sigma factor RpoD, partial [Candidatus Nealsonbacteria bacterium CG08_land_8_20_14_0_20_36_22]
KITIDRAQRIRKFLENPSKIISLETLLGEDEDNISLEFIEDPKVALPVALAFENIFKEDLEKTLKSLTPREEKIIKMRFGLAEDGKEHTLQEIADEMGLSKTRIQQIVKRVLARLRKKES